MANQTLEQQLLAVCHEGARYFSEIVGDSNFSEYEFSSEINREVKAKADNALEEKLVDLLQPLNLAILSEESGLVGSLGDEPYIVLDPLDGTFNFVRGLGPYAISLGLWQDNGPRFGVIVNLLDGRVYYGGQNQGAFVDGTPIRVSSVEDASRGTICTGFPSRFSFSEQPVQDTWHRYSAFAKVRMIGSAAISLTLVASGSAEIYEEREIMLWDVAAGLAIVQGAGGHIQIEPGQHEWGRNIVASNNIVS